MASYTAFLYFFIIGLFSVSLNVKTFFLNLCEKSTYLSEFYPATYYILVKV